MSEGDRVPIIPKRALKRIANALVVGERVEDFRRVVQEVDDANGKLAAFLSRQRDFPRELGTDFDLGHATDVIEDFLMEWGELPDQPESGQPGRDENPDDDDVEEE